LARWVSGLKADALSFVFSVPLSLVLGEGLLLEQHASSLYGEVVDKKRELSDIFAMDQRILYNF